MLRTVTFTVVAVYRYSCLKCLFFLEISLISVICTTLYTEVLKINKLLIINLKN